MALRRTTCRGCGVPIAGGVYSAGIAGAWCQRCETAIKPAAAEPSGRTFLLPAQLPVGMHQEKEPYGTPR